MTLERLLELGALPIINENDTISTEEISIGDNDTLSAMVAASIRADLLILLSDIDGLYDSDPHKNPDARSIRWWSGWMTTSGRWREAAAPVWGPAVW